MSSPFRYDYALPLSRPVLGGEMAYCPATWPAGPALSPALQAPRRPSAHGVTGPERHAIRGTLSPRPSLLVPQHWPFSPCPSPP